MKSYVFHPVLLCVLLGLCGCAEAVTDERLASRTAQFLGVSPSDITISSRRRDGDTIYYEASIPGGGKSYCSYTEQHSGFDILGEKTEVSTAACSSYP